MKPSKYQEKTTESVSTSITSVKIPIYLFCVLAMDHSISFCAGLHSIQLFSMVCNYQTFTVVQQCRWQFKKPPVILGANWFLLILYFNIFRTELSSNQKVSTSISFLKPSHIHSVCTCTASQHQFLCGFTLYTNLYGTQL